VLYRGDAIPAWRGSFLVASLGGEHLQRIAIDTQRRRVAEQEVYLRGARGKGGYGRLRDVVTGPDGAVYVTTSNCDGRGDCPPGKDAILRISAP
jgi:glucose/arabinose dehydrogenase